MSRFRRESGTLVDRYQAQRDAHMIKTVLPSGVELLLSPGRHNEVQKAIIEEFIPRFVSGGVLLYLGDTGQEGPLCRSGQIVTLRNIHHRT